MAGLDSLVRNIKAAVQHLVQLRIFKSTTSEEGITTIKAGAEGCTHMQDYGFYSIPPEGGKGILLYPSANRSNGVLIAAGNKELIPEGFGQGDSGIFNKDGVVVKLSGKTVTISGAEEINTDAPSINFTGDTTEITGTAITVKSDTIQLGEVAKALVTSEVLALLTSHVHPTPGAVSPGLATIDVFKTTKVTGE